jgi:hypothetical protein
MARRRDGPVSVPRADGAPAKGIPSGVEIATGAPGHREMLT